MAASVVSRNIALRLQRTQQGTAAPVSFRSPSTTLTSVQQPRRMLSDARRPFQAVRGTRFSGGKTIAPQPRDAFLPVRAFSTQQPTPGAPETAGGEVESYQPDVLIYNMEISSHCQLIRALLRYLRVPYYTVEVHPFSNAPIHEVDGRDIMDVPIVLIDGVKVAGTQTILRYILWWAKSKNLIPEAKLDQFVGTSTSNWTPPKELGNGDFDVSGITFSQRIKESIDFLETNLTPTVWPWMAPSLGGAEGLMNYSHDVLQWSLSDRYLVSVKGAFWMRNQVRRLRKQLGVKNQEELEALVRKTQATWVERVEAHGPGAAHHGGDALDLADVYMYGVTQYLDHHELNEYRAGRFGQLADNAHWALRRDTRVARIPSKETRQGLRFNMYTEKGEPRPLIWPTHPRGRHFVPMFVALLLFITPGMYIHRQYFYESPVRATEGYEKYEQQQQ